jgi:hypothetical protein
MTKANFCIHLFGNQIDPHKEIGAHHRFPTYRKTGLFWTNFSIFVKFKRPTSKDRSESYVHILMLVRPTN